jgi:sec-independent protein translocase protein TatC
MSDSSTPEKDEMAGSEQPFIQHLKELRDRLVKGAIAVAVVCVVLSVFPGPAQLYDFLAAPLIANLPDGTK